MRILGIDPGYERLGIAILEKNKNQKEELIYSDCFKTSPKDPHSERLGQIGKEIEKIIDKFQPKALSIETLFFNSNQKTAMKVAEARGTVLYVCAKNNLAIHEFTPLQIKMAITGNGRADKRGMIKMIPMLLKISEGVKNDDEFDAIATGLTYFSIKR